MKQTRMILCGAGLLSAVIGLEIAVGKDDPSSEAKRGVPTPAKAKGAEALTPKRANSADSKQDANAESTNSADRPATANQSADEVAIRLTGDAYVKAYCNADAKSIAALFTSDAEYVDEQGDLYQGREAIEAAMKQVFAENTGCTIDIDIEAIRMVSPGVAVEDGTTTFTASEDADPVESRYTAVHVKSNGKWLAASVREHAPKDRHQHRSQLRQLAWLQGEWVDESDDSLVLFSCRAVDAGNFLVRDFEFRNGDHKAVKGTQRIGWDPLTGKLKAWIFDSEGGYSDGFWYRDGNRWILKTSGVTPDGQPVSGTSTCTYIDEDTMTWQCVDREIAGVGLPDSESITIVRRAPTPELDVDPARSTSK